MATFEYVEIPGDAVRLKATTLQPATKILTTLPDTTRASSTTTSEPLSPAKSALALVPQMLLSASIPTSAAPTASIISSAIAPPAPPSQSTLLSTRDPLSVPIMTANFRRFVSKVGPVFWLQDRIEEVILWKKCWKRTVAWIAIYGFFCYFPKMALLVPHILLLAVMLHYYPDPGVPPVPISVGEGTADWQANIQAIQNLMGAFSDMHDAIVPLLPLLVASSSTPAPPKSHSRFGSISEPAITPKLARRPSEAPNPTAMHAQPHHSYLIVTLVTFLLSLPLLVTDLVPIRLIFFLAGAGTVGALHPRIRGLLSVVSTALRGYGPGLSFQLSICVPRPPNPLSLFTLSHKHLKTEGNGHIGVTRPPCIRTFTITIAPRDIHLFLRRLVDNDRLDDAVWRAPLDRVELWENERWVHDPAEGKRRKPSVAQVALARDDEPDGEDDTASTTSTGTVTADTAKPTGPGGTWSKANLKPNERVGWTRGRDGWSGIGGEVSSNLTFSLSSGWSFIDTESWRPDLEAVWAVQGRGPNVSVCVGADQDGWTYTTDTWTHPRPDPRPADGWVTRRRRWTRRVYFKGRDV